jgi:hypothetical protein
MQFDSTLGRPETSSGENRKTQVDRRCVEGVDRALPLIDVLEAKWLTHVKPPCFHHRMLGEIGKDAPVSFIVRVGQGAASNGPPNSEVVELVRDSAGAEAGHDVSQAISADAALRSLEHRLTGEDYRTYVKGLAAEARVDPSDEAAVNRFERKREGRKTSNGTWQNPHDPDAKVGKTKHGATRMIYKPEHVVDLETCAILDTDIRPGDEHDTKELAERVLAVEARINRALP